MAQFPWEIEKMNRLTFRYEWQNDVGKIRGPELQATWARFEIVANGESVTRVIHKKNVRDGIYIPLYPVAEWIVANWWNLLHEVSSPDRLSNGFSKRHDLRAASEGFALPHLQFQPEGKTIGLVWHSSDSHGAGIRFIERGSTTIPLSSAEEVFRDFIEATLERLEEQGVTETALEEEWKAINALDEEERAFCEAFGRLGCDPFAPDSEKLPDVIVQLAGKFPSNVFEELLSASVPAKLFTHSKVLDHLFAEMVELKPSTDPLKKLREKIHPKLGKILATSLPWEQGYELAKVFRKTLGPSPQAKPFDIVHALLEQASDMQFKPSPETAKSLEPLKRTLVASFVKSSTGSPVFWTAFGYESSRGFSFCRALSEYLVASMETSSAIVTRTHSERQKRSRAFAAELLAPAESIRKQIRGDTVNDDDVLEIAETFNTYDMVIRHQIQNHRLARIVKGFSYLESYDDE